MTKNYFLIIYEKVLFHGILSICEKHESSVGQKRMLARRKLNITGVSE
jgi:hypothetical protein